MTSLDVTKVLAQTYMKVPVLAEIEVSTQADTNVTTTDHLPWMRRVFFLDYTSEVMKGDMKTCHVTPRFRNNRGDSWNDHWFNPQQQQK